MQSLGQNTCTWEDGLTLSREACSLWGKSDYGLQRAWLPLFVHMADSSAVAFRLWDEWLPRSTKRVLSSFIEERAARSFFSFVAAVHDIGKATPAFQSQPCWLGALRWKCLFVDVASGGRRLAFSSWFMRLSGSESCVFGTSHP